MTLAEEPAQRREQMLRVLNVISQRFITAGRWESVAQRNLADLGAAAGVSRVYLFQNQRMGSALFTTQRFEWTAPGVAPRLGRGPTENLSFAASGLQRWAALLGNGEAVCGRLEDFPPLEQESLVRQQVRSVAMVPIFVEHRFWGFMGFDDCASDREWSPAEIAVLDSAAAIFGVSLERARAEEALRESEAKYRTIFESALVGLFRVRLGDGKVLEANAVMAQIFGFESREELLATFSMQQSWVEPSELQRLVAELERGGGAIDSFEAQLLRKDRTPVWVRFTARRSPEHGYLEGVAQDISDEKRRKQAEAQMLRGAKLAALGQIIAGVAHEINNPNNFIYFNLPILRRYLEALRPILDAQAEESPGLRLLNIPYEAFIEDLFKLLDNMQHGSERITSIVAELKHYIRGHEEGAERKPTSVRTVVEHVMILVGKQVEKMVKRLEVQVEDGLPSLLAVEGRLEQVLINLLINAGQAADKADSFVRFTARRGSVDRSHVELLVEDNGAGISEENLSRIFDPFFTTKGREAGSGLGLGISQRIVEEHGGTIAVTSSPGQGSRFTVTLPARPEACTMEETAP